MTCALAPRSIFFLHAPVVIHWHTPATQGVGWLFTTAGVIIVGMAIEDIRVSLERRRLERFLRKNNPDAEIFFTEHGQAEKLKEYGWERVPFKWRGLEIWILKQPKSDKGES